MVASLMLVVMGPDGDASKNSGNRQYQNRCVMFVMPQRIDGETTARIMRRGG
jgi:hypothetical protein